MFLGQFTAFKAFKAKFFLADAIIKLFNAHKIYN